MSKSFLEWEYDQYQKQKKTRNQRKRSKEQIFLILFVIAWAGVVVTLLVHTAMMSRAADKTSAPDPLKAEETIMEANRQAQEQMLQENAEISQEFYEEFLAEIQEEQVPKEPSPMDDAITMLAKVIWGEARGCSTMEQAAVVWNILNRVDHPSFGDSIEEVILYPNAYAGYDPNNPVLEEYMRLAEDVLDRWTWEKWDGGDYGRVLPKAYLYFHGDGKANWFRMEYEHTGEYWDWSFENPYEEE